MSFYKNINSNIVKVEKDITIDDLDDNKIYSVSKNRYHVKYPEDCPPTELNSVMDRFKDGTMIIRAISSPMRDGFHCDEYPFNSIGGSCLSSVWYIHCLGNIYFKQL